MSASQWSGCLVVVAVAAAGLVTSAQPQSAGSFAETQAENGRAAYNESCTECHLPDLLGALGPPLAGPNFTNIWATSDASDLFEVVKSTMPQGAEASLGDSTYLNIVAYILQRNGHAAGEEALRADSTLAIGTGA